MKSEKRLNNTIYLMHVITQLYTKEHKISILDFVDLDKKVKIYNYIQKCPDIFDGLPEMEILKRVEEYISDKEGIQA
ncbi:MAG: hypothetical protein IJC02_01910 [Lachnospiraceae bacterium]|nr:hypothetical protein [Lachnospiraceae bacterium]